MARDVFRKATLEAMTEHVSFFIFLSFLLVNTALFAQIKHGKLVYIQIDSTMFETYSGHDTVVVFENGIEVVKAIGPEQKGVFFETCRDTFTVLFSPAFAISFSNQDTSMVRYFDLRSKQSINYQRRGNKLEKTVSFNLGERWSFLDYHQDKARKRSFHGMEGYFTKFTFLDNGRRHQVEMYVTEKTQIGGYGAVPHPSQGSYCPIYEETTNDVNPSFKSFTVLIRFEKLPKRVLRKLSAKIENGEF